MYIVCGTAPPKKGKEKKNQTGYRLATASNIGKRDIYTCCNFISNFLKVKLIFPMSTTSIT